MKYIVLLGDGMADDPQSERDNKTPLELADTPNMDLIADSGRLGLVETVPAGMEPGSDVANMSILGFDPDMYYTGRAAIEAAALGITLKPGQVAFRMNLVSLAHKDGELVMADYSGGHPTWDEQRAIIETIKTMMAGKDVKFVPGVSFRNLCLVTGFDGSPDLKPPHDYAGKPIRDIAPSGPGGEFIEGLQQKAIDLLKDHPVNQARKKLGKPPINGVWFWGMGRPAALPPFSERHGLSSAVVTGVDLIRGLARMLKMKIVEVPGATGYVDTDYEGKAMAVLEVLEEVDFVFLHVEAPDEAGHEGDLDLKIKAIEDFDKRAVGTVLEGLTKFDDYRVLLLPDHETPVRERGHRGGAVPYAVASRDDLAQGPAHQGGFNEKNAATRSAETLSAPLLLESQVFS